MYLHGYCHSKCSNANGVTQNHQKKRLDSRYTKYNVQNVAYKYQKTLVGDQKNPIVGYATATYKICNIV